MAFMNLSARIKIELNQLGIKPKKSLGQNFLINEGIYKKIVAAAEVQRGDMVIEVGPGLGTLTQFLLDADAEILAIEKDNQLAEYLKTKFADSKNVTIVEEDVLRFNPRDTKYNIQNTRYKIVGNIPYYLTSHLLKIIFENWLQPEVIVLMLQKEVAQRITAKPPEMNMLAVLVQYHARPKIISYVSHGSFYPPPEVDSAIIKLEFKNRDIESGADSKNFFKIVKIGFSEKRKQLGNNLSGGLKLEKKIVEEKLKSAGINPTRRAETLTLDEWQRVTNIFSLQD
ncbi:MAG: ribosomal RNA small subunit methyltransferase A [Candidatus Yanofskybacteria bacterium]|nr:ribosomal RNA small subunit methyltransferase A [Candidatus Yanofskybacteria bacterium]